MSKIKVKQLHGRRLNFYKQTWNTRHCKKSKAYTPYNRAENNQEKSNMNMSKLIINSSEEILHEMAGSEMSEELIFSDSETNASIMAGTSIPNKGLSIEESDSDFFSSEEIFSELPNICSQMESLSIKNISPMIYTKLTGGTDDINALYARLADLLQEPNLESMVTIKWDRHSNTLDILGFEALAMKVHRCLMYAVQMIRKQMREGVTSFSYPLSPLDGSVHPDIRINIQAGGRCLYCLYI